MRGLSSFPNIDGPDGDFPDGRVRDKDGTTHGTPVNEFVYGDIHQYFAKMLRLASITPNALPESEYSGFQQIQALWSFINLNASVDLIKGMVPSYISDDLMILWGAKVSGAGPSVISEGAIFYNGIVYKVEGNSVSGTSGLVYKISDGDIKTIYLDNSGSGTGIADVGSSSVKRKLKFKKIPIGSWDMSSENSKTVAHGVDLDEYVGINILSVSIINDDGDIIDLFTQTNAGIAGTSTGVMSTNSTDILLSRLIGGAYDNSNFNDPSVNRGYIMISYGDY